MWLYSTYLNWTCSKEWLEYRIDWRKDWVYQKIIIFIVYKTDYSVFTIGCLDFELGTKNSGYQSSPMQSPHPKASRSSITGQTEHIWLKSFHTFNTWNKIKGSYKAEIRRLRAKVNPSFAHIINNVLIDPVVHLQFSRSKINYLNFQLEKLTHPETFSAHCEDLNVCGLLLTVWVLEQKLGSNKTKNLIKWKISGSTGLMY